MQGTKDLQLSLYQAVVLLLFNDTDTLSFTAIREAVNIGPYCPPLHLSTLSDLIPSSFSSEFPLFPFACPLLTLR
jgi:hypothetical protein